MEININPNFHVFSYPSEIYITNSSFVDKISRYYTQVVIECFLEERNNDLKKNSTGLIEILELVANSESAEFDSIVWSDWIGEMKKTICDNSIDPTRVASKIALHLNSIFFDFSWEATFNRATNLQWDNFVLPKCNGLKVSRKANGFDLHLIDSKKQEKTIQLTQNDNSWEANFPLTELPYFTINEDKILLVNENSSFDLSNEVITYDHCTEPTNLIKKNLSEAFELLNYISPNYYDWVKRVVKKIVLLKAKKGNISSFSSDDFPGVIGFSFPSSPISIAEMLVHESSHQYFYMAEKFENVVDGTDSNLYFSPVKGTDRPIEKILIAFHAFANVALFYQYSLNKEVGDDIKKHSLKQLERHIEELKLMGKILRENKSLTSVGNSLWKPLYDIIFDN